MPTNSYIHESAKEPTAAQEYIVMMKTRKDSLKKKVKTQTVKTQSMGIQI
jgi:hypothetical protein